MSRQVKGIVIAVCFSSNAGIPKHPQLQVNVGALGIEGDYHAGPGRRQVSVVAKETFKALEAELGVVVSPGGFGENVLVEGLGDLSDLQPADILCFASGVELEVTAQNEPCRNLMAHHPLVPKLAYGRRGIVATVRSGGLLKPGDPVWKRAPLSDS